MRKVLLLGFLVLHTMAFSQEQEAFYETHPQLLGTFFTPDQPGWGWSSDIQRGILFSAIFGYDAAGENRFLTMTSDPASPQSPFTFTGSVFLTTNNGSTNQNVGNFTWNFGSSGGQPAAQLSMESPYLTLDQQLLVRFGYVDADQLSVLSGRYVGLGFYIDNNSFLQTLGRTILIGTERMTMEDGTTALSASSLFGEGVAFYNAEAGNYVVSLTDRRQPKDTVIYRFTASHTDWVGSAVYFDRDTQVGDPENFVGTTLQELMATTKNAPAVLSKATMTSIRERAGQIPPVLPVLKN